MSKSCIDWDEFNRWIRQARYTLQLVDADIEHQGYSWACFKAQQAAELALKAILRAFGMPAFGHDLRTLMDNVSEICGVVPPEVSRCAAYLNKLYIMTRYPDVIPSGAPYEYFTLEDAIQAKECAEKILNFVQQCIERAREGTREEKTGERTGNNTS